MSFRIEKCYIVLHQHSTPWAKFVKEVLLFYCNSIQLPSAFPILKYLIAEKTQMTSSGGVKEEQDNYNICSMRNQMTSSDVHLQIMSSRGVFQLNIF